ncbi:hypothetical protein F0919_16560 [Taibaiella lutea]|uniref:Uncharacterized protein n=1 Tax=Taibaiella lutea TaxID=2608001 RepID=A0A5M6CES3_9BACT|nr:hypothetical protein [Taibaiella lutea]KAA5532402.1 hypothetical protein F0919_16560 [Taibaiella lutea]
MKTLLSLLLLSATCFTLTAQTPNRYYPSVQHIFNAPEDKMMNKDFDFFNNWIKKGAQYVFSKDLQTSGSSNGDAAFYSLSLVFRKDSVFQFGNSGFELKIRTDSSGIATPAVLIQQQYKILAYLRSFNPDTYNPADLKNKFQLGLMIYNISEEQAMANFLNNFIVADKKHAGTPLQQLKNDLKQKKKINLVFDEAKDEKILQKIATQIYEQSNVYSSQALYDLYIQSATATATLQKFNQFFRSMVATNASEAIDETVAYNLQATFPKKDVSVRIAEKYIAVFNKEDTLTPQKTALSLSLRSVSLTTVRTTGQKYMKINLAFNPDKDDNRMFKIINVLPKNKVPAYLSSFTYPVNSLDSIELRVYEDYLEGDIFIKQNPSGSDIARLPFLSQKFSLN